MQEEKEGKREEIQETGKAEDERRERMATLRQLCKNTRGKWTSTYSPLLNYSVFFFSFFFFFVCRRALRSRSFVDDSSVCTVPVKRVDLGEASRPEIASVYPVQWTNRKKFNAEVLAVGKSRCMRV